MNQTFSTLIGDPCHIIVGRVLAKYLGGFSTKEKWGVHSRPAYAYGIRKAAIQAQFFGYDKVTICEFGVAHGDGLIEMIRLADQCSNETGIVFNIHGFDTGSGLPSLNGYKDHPEIWSQGDFTLCDYKALNKVINGRATLHIGDISETVLPFINGLNDHAPLGFISVDVDTYTSTVPSLQCFTGHQNGYLPSVITYFDDVGCFFCNPKCGELLAIKEFNDTYIDRIIDEDRTLPGRRIIKTSRWYNQMYTTHILNHPRRNNVTFRNLMTMSEHKLFLENFELI